MENCWLYDRCNHKSCSGAFCIRKFKLDYIYKESMLTDKQRQVIKLYPDADGTDLDKFIQLKGIKDNITDFVSKGDNLYIFSSNCGCGKSSWAIKMMQEYFDKIWVKSELTCRALFVSVPKFLLALKESISAPNEYATFIKNNAKDADLVVWDDISAKDGSEFEINHLLGIIDDRINAGKSNIYTSNVRPEKLYDTLGGRLASRIGNYSTIIELTGADKRNFKEN